MATIHTETRNGSKYRRLQFYDRDRNRRSIRLGPISLADAEFIKRKVEAILSASVANRPLDLDTSEWIGGLGQDLLDKLKGVGLHEFLPAAEPIGEFVDKYLRGRTDYATTTRRDKQQTRDKVVEFFGAGKDLRSVTAADALGFKRWLSENGLSPSTVAGHIKNIKTWFNEAKRRRLIDDSPFAEVVRGKMSNSDRLEFITVETIERVIDAAPNAEWRAIIALARYGGLRVPSELLPLKWSDVDWTENTFTVTSSKTKKQGKPYRVVPLFPELRPYLEDLYDPSEIFVINRYRWSEANLRTQLHRYIRKAGLTPWGKAFQNLRSSRETELENIFPTHVVTHWIGNSEKTARAHYFQVTPDHYRQAIEAPTAPGGATNLKTTPGEPSQVARQTAAEGDAMAAKVEPHNDLQHEMPPTAALCLSNEHPEEDSNL